MSGTQGQSKRLEGIAIELYGEVAEYYDIYYRVHAQDAYSGAAEPPVRRGESHVSGPDGATLLN